MKVLGVDFGERKIGLAIAETPIADPYVVLRFKREEEAIEKILEIILKEGIEKIVVGVSEGKTAKKTKVFIKKLQEKTEVEVKSHDETLSTYEAQRLAIEAGLKRVKRKKLEDAFAATVMLQDYLDNNSINTL
jgi:putative Holliday junction resolvase